MRQLSCLSVCAATRVLRTRESGCSLVLLDQSAEQVAAMDGNRRVGVAVVVGDGAVRRGELERSVLVGCVNSIALEMNTFRSGAELARVRALLEG